MSKYQENFRIEDLSEEKQIEPLRARDLRMGDLFRVEPCPRVFVCYHAWSPRDSQIFAIEIAKRALRESFKPDTRVQRLHGVVKIERVERFKP